MIVIYQKLLVEVNQVLKRDRFHSQPIPTKCFQKGFFFFAPRVSCIFNITYAITNNNKILLSGNEKKM